MKEEKVISRKFLGNTKGKLSYFDKAHLKAYLKGKVIFNCGLEPVVFGKVIAERHLVKQQLIMG